MTALLQELAAAPYPEQTSQLQLHVLAPGSVVAGRFELVREISRGGFGVVFEAWDRQLSRRVAFKILRPSRRARLALAEQALLEEAEVAARLRHPNIVTVFDVGSCEAGPYVILELLQGETLAARLERGPLPAREAVRAAIEMARGLEHAHGAGVVHRDVKPSNVFLDDDGSVKLLDFGIALALGTSSSAAAGTPGYMAPEVSLGSRGDERSDVFGLGTVLFEMLTGRPAYAMRHGRSTALEPGPEPSLSAPGVRAPLAALVREMLSKDPEARPWDGAMVLDRLHEVERHLVALRDDEAFEARYLHWRRAFLIGAGALVLQLPLDVRYGWSSVTLRLLWIALLLAIGRTIHPRHPRLSLAGVHTAALLSGVATSAIIALSGGSSSARFGFLLALPPMLLGLLPDMPAATVFVGVGTLCGGIGILAGEGRDAWWIAEWASLSFLVTAFAVVASVLFRRTILGELGAQRARESAPISAERAPARRSRLRMEGPSPLPPLGERGVICDTIDITARLCPGARGLPATPRVVDSS
jgi:serine/threonine protein kinase/heme exporter protein D